VSAVAEPIRVLLVEDNVVFQQTLELLLGLRADIEVVGAVGDGARAPAVCAELQPEVVLMDYRLPGLDGVEATKAVRAASPRSAVVCLTAAASPRELEALEAAGAIASLSKDAELDEIVGTIRRAAGRVASSE
jgi:two-component system, NarL family, response regulator DesR